MTTKIDKEEIVREKGYLYFIGKDGYIWAAPMKHNKTGKKKKVGTVKHERPNIRDITDKGGFVAKAKMKNSEEPE